MFTGIIEATAAVLKRTDGSLTIERPVSFDDLKKGCSVAVMGTCLTVISFDSKTMLCDVIPETWSHTKLGQLKPGDRVNLERAMPVNGRFDGHIVQGHIEGVGEVTGFSAKRGDARLTITVPKVLQKYIMSKGSVTIDGVALTVASVKKDQVTVALIPETLKVTTLGALKKGDPVNIETDMIGRYVYAFLPRP